VNLLDLQKLCPESCSMRKTWAYKALLAYWAAAKGALHSHGKQVPTDPLA
jgi:hypothetical protein